MNEQRTPKPSPLAGEGAERGVWGLSQRTPHPAARRLPALCAGLPARVHPLPQGERVTSLRHGTWSHRSRCRLLGHCVRA